MFQSAFNAPDSVITRYLYCDIVFLCFIVFALVVAIIVFHSAINAPVSVSIKLRAEMQNRSNVWDSMVRWNNMSCALW